MDPLPAPLALAPAAGVGFGRIIADRMTRDPTFAEEMIEAARGALKATRTVWNTGKGGKAESVTEPDHKARLQAFTVLMAHLEGEPLRRQVTQYIGADATAALANPLQALEQSDALQDAAELTLRRAKRRRRRPEQVGELVIE